MNNINEYTEPPTEESSHAVAVRAAEPPQESVMITPAQARVESVAAVLDAAYRNASNLRLTPEESEALAADFPDEAFRLGAGGDDNLLYLEHAYLRKRLNDVLGIGAATPIRRREWAEEFTYFKDRQEKRGVRVYVDLVLLVRGCVVGEAIGDAVYYPDNAKQNYSDALESAKSNAFRRAAKEFGVGLQPWMKGFCEGWKQRNRNGSQSARREYPLRNDPPPRQNAPQGQPRPAAASSDVLPAKATAKTQEWAWNSLTAEFPSQVVWAFFMSKGWVPPEGTYDLWPLEHVPTSKQALAALADEIRRSLPHEPPQDAPQGEDEMPPEIANAVITLPRKGMKRADYLQNVDTIGSLYRAMKEGDAEARRRLWGVAKNWMPEPWIGNDGKKHPPNQADSDCRIALDMFLDWSNGKGETGE